MNYLEQEGINILYCELLECVYLICISDAFVNKLLNI
jgi:hypothetical protein